MINDKLTAHLERSGLLTDYQNSFRTPHPTDSLFRVVTDTTARAFKVSGATVILGLVKSAEVYLELN